MKKLLDVLAERGIGDRNAGHETLTGSAFDRTTEARCARVAGLTQHGIDPREELRRLERLGDVIGGPAREATGLVHDLDDYHAGRRCVRADRFLYRFHFFFVFFVPSVSPRSHRIATMNFEGRSSRVFSLRYACRSTAQCGSSPYHFISTITSGSMERSEPSGEGASPESPRDSHGSAKYMRLWSAVIRSD